MLLVPNIKMGGPRWYNVTGWRTTTAEDCFVVHAMLKIVACHRVGLAVPTLCWPSLCRLQLPALEHKITKHWYAWHRSYASPNSECGGLQSALVLESVFAALGPTGSRLWSVPGTQRDMGAAPAALALAAAIARGSEDTVAKAVGSERKMRLTGVARLAGPASGRDASSLMGDGC